MTSSKFFAVFGDLVEVLVPCASTSNSFSMIVQHTEPGGGPPPHFHEREDEIFAAIEGDFELFNGTAWKPLPIGEHHYSLRGHVHTFRNCGDSIGRILIIATPGGIEEYLERISTLALPQDMDRLISISNDFGITFVLPNGATEPQPEGELSADRPPLDRPSPAPIDL